MCSLQANLFSRTLFCTLFSLSILRWIFARFLMTLRIHIFGRHKNRVRTTISKVIVELSCISAVRGMLHHVLHGVAFLLRKHCTDPSFMWGTAVLPSSSIYSTTDVSSRIYISKTFFAAFLCRQTVSYTPIREISIEEISLEKFQWSSGKFLMNFLLRQNWEDFHNWLKQFFETIWFQLRSMAILKLSR